MMDSVVDIGLLARKADHAFCQTMESAELGFIGSGETGIRCLPEAVVYHGDCSLLRLSDRFYLDQNKEYYRFVKLEHYDEFQENANFKSLFAGEDLYIHEVLEMTGPPGVGKSFYLQYILRHVRACGKLRALYLGNPDGFFHSPFVYHALFLELVYSLAEDINSDVELRAKFRKAAIKLIEKPKNCFATFTEIFTDAIKHLKESENKTQFLIVLDQESAYERLIKGPSSSAKKRLAEFLKGYKHGAHILSSFSYTNETFKKGGNPTQLVRFLSDRELLTILASRCGKWERCRLLTDTKGQDSDVKMTLDTVVNSVGRCPVDIHHMMNTFVDGCTENTEATISERCEAFEPDTAEILRRHQAFHGSLEPGQKEDFLLLLSIAGRCPPIGAEGYYSFGPLKNNSTDSTTSSFARRSFHAMLDGIYANLILMEQHSRSLDGTAYRLAEKKINTRIVSSAQHRNLSQQADKPAPPVEDNYMGIEVFADIEGFTYLSDIQWSNSALDRQYFFIDSQSYVRPYSEQAFKAIKAYHQVAKENSAALDSGPISARKRKASDSTIENSNETVSKIRRSTRGRKRENTGPANGGKDKTQPTIEKSNEIVPTIRGSTRGRKR